MFGYSAPLKDMQFVYRELLFTPGAEDAPDKASIERLLTDSSAWAQAKVAPYSGSADLEGCELTETGVCVPDWYRELYQEYCQLGGLAATGMKAYGGSEQSVAVGLMLSEIIGAADWAWSLYTSMSVSVMRVIEQLATPEQKELWLPRLYSGDWTATVCISEAQGYVDLSMIRTRAIPDEHSNYRVSGRKVHVAGGDHDLSDNILYLTLARDPDDSWPSLFIIPKYDIENPTVRNAVQCDKLEQKMGVRGNATCTMSFDRSVAYRLGSAAQGFFGLNRLKFESRLLAGLQGVTLSEKSFQGSRAYAMQRRLSTLSQVAADQAKLSDPIIRQPGIQHMLSLQRAIAEAGRSLVYEAGTILESLSDEDDDNYCYLQCLLDIANHFLTDISFESASLGMQVLGPYGYLSEWGLEQNLRDCRTALTFNDEAPGQIFSLSSLKSSKGMNPGLAELIRRIEEYCEKYGDDRNLKFFTLELSRRVSQWRECQESVLNSTEYSNQFGHGDREVTHFWGYCALAYYWSLMAASAYESMAAGNCDSRDFYREKIAVARFYFNTIFPRTEALIISIRAMNSDFDLGAIC
ncbi:acyl-CoA dehydrogenase C-terminal domain-containing protein [Microbulbifer hainanensis]|uniref:acyl-CoA dehydrogenase C-terminal domain-containing protein n=1 Tax=Microbulbifer hainanensis TaxID=2735675 RepID=UPI001868DEB7|nr:acyl-CoA dehydrogenase C-terminal domain-containing protein [Microbulbifer hainanensis]